MDATELLSLAGSIASVGVENITAFDAPLVTDVATDADGNLVETGLQAVDAVQLAITLGLLVPGAYVPGTLTVLILQGRPRPIGADAATDTLKDVI